MGHGLPIMPHKAYSLMQKIQKVESSVDFIHRPFNFYYTKWAMDSWFHNSLVQKMPPNVKINISFDFEYIFSQQGEI
jgi:hypothetical protein